MKIVALTLFCFFVATRGNENPFVRGRKLAVDDQCVQGFKPAKRLGVPGEPADGLDTIHPYKKPQKPGAALHPCPEFSQRSCCSNVGAQEIGDAFDHLMNIGGSGGVPINEERCLLIAKENHIALKDYMCMYCNPHQNKYMGCCDEISNDTTTCLSTLKKTGDVGCDANTVNTVRVCKSFADALWGDDGSKYDGCGMMMWVADPVATEDPANPNNWLSWGALEGKHGDDPVTPSVTWSGQAKYFFRDVKPPLFDQFYVVIVDDDDTCFNGYMLNNEGTASQSAKINFASSLGAIIVTVLLMYLH
jgi:hypothetical protein